MSATGLDLNGLCDRRSVLAALGGESTSFLHPVRPPVVVISTNVSERPLAGTAAFDAIAGRGWAWPDEARAGGSPEASARQPVMTLLAAARRGADNISTRFGVRNLDNILTAHLRSLLAVPDTVGDQVCLAVPDDWSEDARQVALDSVRAAVPAVQGGGAPAARLLWRPVAALFGWSAGMEPASLAALHGRSALVVSLLPDRCMVSVLDLEVAATEEGPLLTPVRSRPGLTSDERSIWISDIIDEQARTVARRWGDDAVRRQLLWGTGVFWRVLIGEEESRPLLLQHADGRWLLIEEPPPAPSADAGAGMVETVAAVVRLAIMERQDAVGVLLIEGPLTAARFGGRNLGDLVAARVTHDGGAHTPVFICPSDIVARGCAEHPLRLAAGLPTYFDFLPQLAILATRECRPDFIDLIPGSPRIAGGDRYGREVANTFELAPGAESLRFLIHKADEPHVRESHTDVPSPPAVGVPLTLRVTQEPGQGRAAVEIVPDSPTVFAGGSVLLDWKEMTSTSKLPAAVLAAEGGGGVPYPDSLPEQGHWALWAAYNIGDRIAAFLNIDPVTGGQRYGQALQRLLEGFRVRAAPAKLPLPGLNDTNKYRPVSSDGCLPVGLDSIHCRLPHGAASFEELFETLRRKIDGDFQQLPQGAKERQRLYLLAAWCYAAAPGGVMRWLKDHLYQAQTGADRWVIEAIGRCLSDPDDIIAFFDIASARLKDEGGYAVDRASHWIKATAQIMMFRENASLHMTEQHARALVGASVASIDQQMATGNLRVTFYWSIALLLFTLRYRRRNCGFCRPGTRAHDVITERLDDAVTKAGKVNAKAAELIRQTRDFIAFKGNPSLPRMISEELD